MEKFEASYGPRALTHSSNQTGMAETESAFFGGAGCSRSVCSVRFDRILNADAKSFRHLGRKGDHERKYAEWIVYDAL